MVNYSLLSSLSSEETPASSKIERKMWKCVNVWWMILNFLCHISYRQSWNLVSWRPNDRADLPVYLESPLSCRWTWDLALPAQVHWVWATWWYIDKALCTLATLVRNQSLLLRKFYSFARMYLLLKGMAWIMFGFKLCCGETFQCLFRDGFPLSLGDGKGRQHCQQGKRGVFW